LPSLGLAAAAVLIGVALAALASLRRLRREHRLLGRLRQKDASAVTLDGLSEEERHTAFDLARAGVVQIQGQRMQLQPAQLAAFRARSVRLMLSGAFVALVLITLLVAVLRR
jgi:hypothetical protein